MVIRESGLIFRGFSVVKKSFHKSTIGKIDTDLRSAMMTAFINFAKSAYSSKIIDYLELKKYCIAFIGDEIQSLDGDDPESLIAYAILDKEKRTDRHVRKLIKPLLNDVMNQFILENEGKNLTETNQFKYFKKNMKKILGSTTQTMEEKALGTLF